MREQKVYKFSQNESLDIMESLQDADEKGTFYLGGEGIEAIRHIIREHTRFMYEFNCDFEIIIKAKEHEEE